MEFPYGKAPLAILILTVISGAVLAFNAHHEAPHPDLIYATFTKEHADDYRAEIPAFEKENGCTVQIELVDQQALQNRLESALIVGAEVPDMVELLDGTMGFFTKGPLENVGFVDLTDRVKDKGPDGLSLFDKVVQSRFAKWSSRGHIFGLSHDVHPAMLAYRRDLVENLGIDVNKLTTWDEFCRVGREVVAKSRTKDGVVQHYMLDLPADGSDALWMLILQKGATLFDKDGNVTFDDPRVVDTVIWYVEQVEGPGQIAFDAQWGQNLAKAMDDGLTLFVISPDWRTAQFEADMPNLSGKMALMPLPAWTPGGIRTSTWGGTGLVITKQCEQRGKLDLAWKLANYLYYNTKLLGPRFRKMNIIPPLKAAWKLPELNEPRAYWSGIRLGQVYAALAPFVPEENSNAYQNLGRDKLAEAFANCSLYYREHGETGLHDYATAEVHRCAERVKLSIERNAFLAKGGQANSNGDNQ